MRVSLKWLQTYFDAELPPASEIVSKLTFHAFEVERSERAGDDVVMDIDVLPNRSSDCLSHRGIAKEISVLFDLPLVRDPLREPTPAFSPAQSLSVSIEDSTLCRRFSAARVRGVSVGPSPAWLQERLTTLGQKPINNVVDITNFVMFNLGQPLHAFDAGKLAGKGDNRAILVRRGNAGESITALDGVTHETGLDTLLIADGNSNIPLGIAGIKGGKYAEVEQNTRDIIIEAANFDPVNVRRTSRRLKLRTDASVRFENEPSRELTVIALNEAVGHIIGIAGGELEGVSDEYPNREEEREVSVAVDEINALLGSEINESAVEKILDRFGFSYMHRRGNFTVKVPFERLDIGIEEDLIEEVGRVYGYENMAAAPLPLAEKEPEVNKRFYYGEKVRDFLLKRGYSEVYTYTLRDRGEVELQNPLSADKGFLRNNLRDGLRESLELNLKNAPLLGLDTIRLFEVGEIFAKRGEYVALGIGVTPEEKGELGRIVKELGEKLGGEIGNVEMEDGVVQVSLDALIERLPQPKHYDAPVRRRGGETAYKPISPYPFALRDIAVWTSKGTNHEEAIAVIKKEAGNLLASHSLFDVFKTEGRVSYAFHLVFQSDEKTLGERELAELMERVERALNARSGWEVR